MMLKCSNASRGPTAYELATRTIANVSTSMARIIPSDIRTSRNRDCFQQSVYSHPDDHRIKLVAALLLGRQIVLRQQKYENASIVSLRHIDYQTSNDIGMGYKAAMSYLLFHNIPLHSASSDAHVSGLGCESAVLHSLGPEYPPNRRLIGHKGGI